MDKMNDKELWENIKKKHNLTSCVDCDDIKLRNDVLELEERRCIFCMYFWLG